MSKVSFKAVIFAQPTKIEDALANNYVKTIHSDFLKDSVMRLEENGYDVFLSLNKTIELKNAPHPLQNQFYQSTVGLMRRVPSDFSDEKNNILNKITTNKFLNSDDKIKNFLEDSLRQIMHKI